MSLFSFEMKVRDYELDAQGVVNNANYLHYLEATRHEWLQQEGFSFQAWHEQGIDAMVSEINIRYKTPLRGQEWFVSTLDIERKGPRFIFHQNIYRKADMQPVVIADVTIFFLINGGLSRGDEMAQLFAKYLG